MEQTQEQVLAWVGDRVQFREADAEHTGVVTGITEMGDGSRLYDVDTGTGVTSVRDVERTGEVDWQVRYDALVEAIVDKAKDEEWCEQFEEVMAGAGFHDIASKRERTFEVTVWLTYTLDVYRLDRILADEFGGKHDTHEDVQVRSKVTVQVKTRLDPHRDDLEDSTDLADALSEAGYADWDSIEIDEWQ